MNQKIIFTQVLIAILIVLTGCGGTSGKDKAVCNTYQTLVDTWPADSETVQSAESAEAVFDKITAMGESLITVSESAKTTELGEAGISVGEAASTFAEKNAKLIKQGFVPFFSESLIGGKRLSQLCEEIGVPIEIP
jgi:hypothetical protein